MKNILVTQRVEYVKEYNEKRDSLDQKWPEFLISTGIQPIILPNNISCLTNKYGKHNIDGILFTGGNTLVKYGGDAPERDKLEAHLLKWALSKDVPVIGVCRGMHILQDFFGVRLVEVSNHIDNRHKLLVQGGKKLSSIFERYNTVNSYHKFGAFESVEDLIVVARSEDEVIMAIEHRSHRLYGIMWHCEREQPFSEHDRALFKKILC